jgi:Na+/H+ antiporter NhaD/arsenite permease-like protein
MDPSEQLQDPKLARQALAVLGLTVVGFVTHQFLHLESATVALMGASLLLLVVRPNPEEVFHHVEWPVIFFFVGLFILVGAIEAVGVIEWLARQAILLTGGELAPTSMAILWVSAIASAFIDNIPFTATMIPIIHNLGQMAAFESLGPLWWSLSLGACLGGNGTIIGASANVVASGMLEEKGYRMSFLRFMALGFPLMVLSIAISSAYLYLFYLS